MTQHPILWTFRRCPYAMRARLAIMSAGVAVELREVLLRNKPHAFLQTSPSGTVPALRLEDQVLDESLDIMIWALRKNDPQQLLDMPEEGWSLIATNDGPFKAALDHTKYATRYPDLDETAERAKAAAYLVELNDRLNGRHWLFGDRPTLADLALLPFVRQFAQIDRVWFDAQAWPHLIAWLDRFLDSEPFALVMDKYAPWSEGDAQVWFGGKRASKTTHTLDQPENRHTADEIAGQGNGDRLSVSR
ncbi:glutathione S-transferase N-terminal domain-containing protein [Ruegeria lacuscaerulensis]|uniref:glutathione S-transferase N-terminal domain-containing protein n=1 Tax=Ruegeria lacuscaerulensis TaxID=55218 RepID=UPI001479F359